MEEKEHQEHNVYEHHHFIDKIILLNGLVSGIGLYPEVFRALVFKKDVAISLVTLVIILVNSFVWLLYSLHRTLRGLFVSSLLNVIATVFLLFASFISSLF
jgi:uncharacterized protein with PQ loop repeat